jgi:transposase
MEQASQKKSTTEHYAQPYISKVLEFLGMFMPVTVAKRIVSIIVLSIGVSIEETARISGFCERTVYSIKKKMDAGEVGTLFVIGGGGRTSPLADFESDILDEINKNAYHTKQQIADMIFEKHGVKISQQAVGKFLKKKALSC